MVFWIILAVLGLIAAAILALPLLRVSRGEPGWQEGALAIYADQLKEVEADATRGVITSDEAQAATIEIKRRILAVSRAEVEPSDLAAGTNGGGRGLIAAVAVVTPLAAFAIYMGLGAPGTPSLAFADRQEEQQEAAEIAELTNRLLNRLRADPDGGPTQGWVLLAQTYMRMGRYPDASEALAVVVERPEADSAIWSQYAEALIAKENGVITPLANRAIERAVEMDPTNPAGTYYKALSLEQAGQGEAAHDLLTERLYAEQGFAPWMELFVMQANRIGQALGRESIDLASFAPVSPPQAPGPTEADVAAAAEMSEEDRAAFVRSMVARLAQRLEDEPNDLDGWIRLANAYDVLGEAAKSKEAYLRARELAKDLSPDDPRLPQIAAGIENAGEGE